MVKIRCDENILPFPFIFPLSHWPTNRFPLGYVLVPSPQILSSVQDPKKSYRIFLFVTPRNICSIGMDRHMISSRKCNSIKWETREIQSSKCDNKQKPLKRGTLWHKVILIKYVNFSSKSVKKGKSGMYCKVAVWD